MLRLSLKGSSFYICDHALGIAHFFFLLKVTLLVPREHVISAGLIFVLILDSELIYLHVQVQLGQERQSGKDCEAELRKVRVFIGVTGSLS